MVSSNWMDATAIVTLGPRELISRSRLESIIELGTGYTESKWELNRLSN